MNKITKLIRQLIPKKKEDLEEKVSAEEERGLVVVAIGDGQISEVYCVDEKHKILIARRSRCLRAICLHERRLYDGGDYEYVSDTFERTVINRNNTVYTLCSHEGKLYDGGDYGIFDTLKNEVIARRDGSVSVLCSHKGKLYDNGRFGREGISISTPSGYIQIASGTGEVKEGVVDTFKNKIIAERKSMIWAICSHGGRLYDAGLYGGVFDTLDNKLIAERDKDYSIGGFCSHEGRLYDYGNGVIFDTFKNKKIAERKYIWSVCSHEGKLYDGGLGVVFDTFENKCVWEFEPSAQIFRMISIPMDVWESLAKNEESRVYKINR